MLRNCILCACLLAAPARGQMAREILKELISINTTDSVGDNTAAARAKGLDPEGALRLHATQVMRDVEERVSTAAR